MQQGSEQGKDKKEAKSGGTRLFLRDAGIAFAIVVCILVGMYAYTGLWPPLVVVESNSMQHDDDRSYVGVIDTGDLVLVKKVGKASDIQTYVDGVASGHRTYGDYGDVIVYKKLGSDAYTPIIHRAIIYLQANTDGRSYSAPSLNEEGVSSELWSTSNPSDTWLRLTSTLTLYNLGVDQDPFYRSVTITIPIATMISQLSGAQLPSGFITMGDHNSATDQQSSMGVGLRPVEIDWVVGKARGEIPWFGLLKLWVTDSLGNEAPSNSVRNLWISLALIVIVPVAIDIALTYKEKRSIKLKKLQREEVLPGARVEEAADEKDEEIPQEKEPSGKD